MILDASFGCDTYLKLPVLVRIQQMNIELARTFLEIVSTGSMAKAADRLHVTHSTVTMRVKALEELLRRQVLIRNKSGISMTAAGVRFHRFAEALVRTWQMTRRQMSLASGFTGIISIGADTLLWDDIMFDWVCQSRRARPDLAIHCEDGDAEYLVNRLFQGWLDICVVYEARTISGFTVEPLFDDPLIIASTEKRSLRETFDPDYIEIYWDEGIRAQEELFWGEADETPHVSTMSSSLGMRLVSEFGGSVIVPVRSLKSGPYKDKLYALPGCPVLPRKAYLIYSPETLRERLPGITIEQVKEEIVRLFNALN